MTNEAGRRRCEHPVSDRQRFWQTNTAVCKCGHIVKWEEVIT